MKYSIIIFLFAFMANGCGYGQYPKSVINGIGKIYNINAQTKPVRLIIDSGSYTFQKADSDTVYVVSKTFVIDTIWRTFDTLKVIMQVSDTSRSAWDTKIYWMKGYKVLGDYDTYYLDILKQPLRKSIIVWLDQNL